MRAADHSFGIEPRCPGEKTVYSRSNVLAALSGMTLRLRRRQSLARKPWQYWRREVDFIVGTVATTWSQMSLRITGEHVVMGKIDLGPGKLTHGTFTTTTPPAVKRRVLRPLAPDRPWSSFRRYMERAALRAMAGASGPPRLESACWPRYSSTPRSAGTHRRHGSSPSRGCRRS